MGTFEELQKSGIDFMTLLNENKEYESPKTIHSRAENEIVVPKIVNDSKSRTKSELLFASEDESRKRSSSIGADESFEMRKVLMTSYEFQLNYESIIQLVCIFIDWFFFKISNKEKLNSINPKIKEEKREIGSIKATVYWKYIKAGGNFFQLLSCVDNTLDSI